MIFKLLKEAAYEYIGVTLSLDLKFAMKTFLKPLAGERDDQMLVVQEAAAILPLLQRRAELYAQLLGLGEEVGITSTTDHQEVCLALFMLRNGSTTYYKVDFSNECEIQSIISVQVLLQKLYQKALDAFSCRRRRCVPDLFFGQCLLLRSGSSRFLGVSFCRSAKRVET